MNLFQKYGIKEVADVVFYSITTVGDEDFYTPVLFLDTLKVSTLEKTAEKVVATGGKGNKKLITWNFGKEVTLNLEDALFSPASMSMIWGGKLNSKLSDYTSTIVKGNLANKYYDNNYSIKAYPSPALTENEWEIVFSSAEELGYNSESGTLKPDIYNPKDEEYVQNNRNSFMSKYFGRNRKNVTEDFLVFEPSVINNIPDIEPKIYNNIAGDLVVAKKMEDVKVKYDTADIIKRKFNQLKPGEETSFNFSLTDIRYSYKNAKEDLTGSFYWDNDIKEDGNILIEEVLSLRIKNDNGELVISSANSENFAVIKPYPQNTWYDFFAPETSEEEAEFTKNEGLVTLNLSELSKAIQALPSNKVLPDYPLPKEILENIISKINTIEKIGYMDTDIHDIEVIDRMEKCIVKDKKGLTINTQKQKDNLFKYYSDDRSSSYTIFYDAKTMLPLLPIENGEISDIENFTIKIGTIYYKWTRTVKYKESDDDTILGKTLVIDAETFPDAYKIVGETYIRNQKTGKDQRYQFTIHRANVSTDTSVTLEAEGDPTTFSMQIDVLTPPNDIMMELKQYDVEDDPLEGGTRIVPQKSKYTYTPANIEYVEEIADKNEEIY